MKIRFCSLTLKDFAEAKTRSANAPLQGLPFTALCLIQVMLYPPRDGFVTLSTLDSDCTCYSIIWFAKAEQTFPC